MVISAARHHVYKKIISGKGLLNHSQPKANTDSFRGLKTEILNSFIRKLRKVLFKGYLTRIYKVVLNAASVDEILKWTITPTCSAASTIVFLIVSWKEVLSFESMDEFLKSLLSCSSVYNTM